MTSPRQQPDASTVNIGKVNQQTSKFQLIPLKLSRTGKINLVHGKSQRQHRLRGEVPHQFAGH
jgi:hypothetical protein